VDRISIPSSQTLREKAMEIVSGPDYHINTGQSDNSWSLLLLLEIIRWILIPFIWLFELTEGLPDLLRWVIVLGLAAVLILLIGHIVYTLVTAIRRPKQIGDKRLDSRHRRIDPEEVERLAIEAAGGADYVTAIRLLFRSSVLRLELAEKKSHRPGTTNRELLRRYQARPSLRESLKLFVETIDRKWYGDEICSDADYAACQQAHREVRRALGEPAHADGT
jgi:Domain of unknown function (DUF4129)